MKRSYDLIAPVYDKLVMLVFGNALHNAQTYHVSLIPPSSSILIAGGGTGRILEEITRIHPQGLYIDYIDVSAGMLKQAGERDAGSNEVHFINQSLPGWTPHLNYDVIITPFFFDNFSGANAQKVFAVLHSSLRTNGLWLYTDFQVSHPKAYWQKALLFIMYSFFRITANIEARQLPDMVSLFQKGNYKEVKTNTFFHRFIITSVFRKTTAER